MEDKNKTKEELLKELKKIRKRISELEKSETERGKVEETLHKSERELIISNKISEIFLTFPDEQMYEKVLNIILELLESKYGTFGYFNEDGSFVVPSMARKIYWKKCNVPEKDIIFECGTFGGIWGRAVKERITIFSNKGSYKTPNGHIPIKNTIVTPIIYKDKVISAIHIANKSKDYDEEDKALLEMIAGYVAPVLYARLERDKQEKERKLAESALRESEKKFQSIIENLPMGIHMYQLESDGQLRFVGANPAADKILGVDNSQYIGKTIFEAFPGISKTEIPERFKNIAEKGGFWKKEDINYKDESISGAFENYNFQTSSGKIVSLFQDITERKKAEEELRKYRGHLEELVEERTSQLEASNKELEAFSYSVSHDLRAPLRAIDGFSKIFLEDYTDKLDDEGKRVLNVIRSNTNKMGELINDLLEFSRLGRKKTKLSDINMDKLANSTFEELKLITPNRKLKFNIKTLPSAKGDQSMIHHVFINLLSNAIKFTEPKETAVIEVGGQEKKEEIIYYVKDNGVGFDMKYVDKLFGVFQRLHTTEEFEGTGVGLALVKRIINKHGGRVWAEGKVNEGATFYFTLPIKGEKND